MEISRTGSDREPKIIVLPYVPMPARFDEYNEFAHEFDGYSAYPGDLAAFANEIGTQWASTGALPEDLTLLRCCLFYEARRARFIEGYPSDSDMPYWDALAARIKKLMAN